MDSGKNETQEREGAKTQGVRKNALRLRASAPLRFLFSALLTVPFIPASHAEETPAKFPANSPEPMTELAPARGIPAYDGDSESVKRDMVSPASPQEEEETSRLRPKEDPRMKQLREGITMGSAAGTLGWRLPVSMHSGATGEMRAWSYGGEGSLRHVNEDLVVSLSVDYTRTDYAFDGSPALGWRDTDRYNGLLYIESTVSGGWGAFATTGLRAGAEDGANLGDGLSGFVVAGARYRFIPEFSYYFGVIAATRLDRDPLIIPITAFDIRFGKWSLRSMNGFLLAYDVYGDDSLVFEATTLFDNSYLRLSPEAGTGRKRSVEFQEVPLTLAVTKGFGRHAFVKLSATAILWSDYRFRTDEKTSGDFQTDPGLSFGLSAGARF